MALSESNATQVFMDYLTTGQAAERLSVTPEWVRQLAEAGRLTAFVCPVGYLVDPASVETYKATRTGKNAGK